MTGMSVQRTIFFNISGLRVIFKKAADRLQK